MALTVPPDSTLVIGRCAPSGNLWPTRRNPGSASIGTSSLCNLLRTSTRLSSDPIQSRPLLALSSNVTLKSTPAHILRRD